MSMLIARPGVIAASRRRSAGGGGGTGYSAAVLTDNPLLYVRFEETAGATCANSGSLAGNATAAGTYTRNYTTGLPAGCSIGIDLDGASGVVTYPDTASLDITGDVTYECWFNADTSSNMTLLSKGLTSTLAGYEIQLRASGSIIRVKRAGGSTGLLDASSAWTTGTWTHLAFTRSGNNYAIYVNGSSFTTGTNSTTIDATSEAFYIGSSASSGTANAFFNGKMDEVAVYNTALSSGRISAHYSARTS